jgi:TolA-binding protein
MGYSFAEMKETKDAKAFLQRVIDDFPKSEEAKAAAKKLATMK